LELKPNIQQVNYLWQDGKIDSNYTVTKNGIYSLKVTNFCGEANDSIEVNFEENPTINLGNDTILCDDKELVIQLPKKYNYVWQDNRLDTFYNITKTGLYKVTASNYCGNVNDEIKVSFIDCSCTQYFIPDAFTPKNDGLNDWFYPIANCEPIKFSFSIYNRWGSEVFYTNNHKENWDGKFNGKECQADVYFYTLNYQFPLTTTKSINGTVTLIR
jgi:gliding motility-associated-like protein